MQIFVISTKIVFQFFFFFDRNVASADVCKLPGKCRFILGGKTKGYGNVRAEILVLRAHIVTAEGLPYPAVEAASPECSPVLGSGDRDVYRVFPAFKAVMYLTWGQMASLELVTQ